MAFQVGLLTLGLDQLLSQVSFSSFQQLIYTVNTVFLPLSFTTVKDVLLYFHKVIKMLTTS